MPIETIEQFRGFETEADNYSTKGSINMLNWDIDINGDLIKSKGYTLVGDGSDTIVKEDDTSDIILSESGEQLITQITLDAIGINLVTRGAFFDGSYIYAFIGTTTEHRLYRTSRTTISWSQININGESDTTWAGSDKGYFVQYEGNTIFVKGESKAIGVNTGGVFYIDGSNEIALFGTNNNPTAKHIEIHNERIFVGNISKIAAGSVSGQSWVMASKVYPEATDTSKTINATGCALGVRTLIKTTAAHGFVAGDIIYISGVAADSGLEILNESYWTVTESKDADEFYIDADTSADVSVAPADGTISLRNTTWSPSTNPFDNVLIGPGIFKCDDNQNDGIMRLVSQFGNLVILRQNSIYFMTGAIATGSQVLARRLNVPYGAVSSEVGISSGGIWFMSRWGLSKIEGVTVKSARTELDNVLSVTISETIKTAIEAIADRSAVLIHSFDRFIWLHDPSSYTFILDTLTGNWSRQDGKLLNDLVDIVDEEERFLFGLYGGLVFKMDDGYKNYVVSTRDTPSITSEYQTGVYEQGNFYIKDYQMFYVMLQGFASASDDALTVEIFMDGDSVNKVDSLQFSLLPGGTILWKDDEDSNSGFLYNGTQVWSSFLDGIKTWQTFTGVQASVQAYHAWRLGHAKNIQFKYVHTNASKCRISRTSLQYRVLNSTLFSEEVS